MLLSAAYFILAILILVLFHELGHFVVARACGVQVLRFSFGFGKILFSWYDKHRTQYSWSLFPVGGYIKMLDENVEPVEPAKRHLAFNNKPLWMRTCVVLAGPAFNFILAFLLLWLVLVMGVKSVAPIIGSVETASIAEQVGIEAQQEILSVDSRKIESWRDFQYAIVPFLYTKSNPVLLLKSKIDGNIKQVKLPMDAIAKPGDSQDLLANIGITPYIPKVSLIVGEILENSNAKDLQPGDQILTVNNQKLESWQQLVTIVQAMPNKQITLLVVRSGQQKSINITVGSTIHKGKSIGFLGIKSQPVHFPKDYIRIHSYQILAAGNLALIDTVALTKTTCLLLWKMLTGKLSLKNLSGPVGIAQTASDSAHFGLGNYLSFIALLSIGLGVLNLLPIPMLDGGHILFYLLEFLLRKPLSQEFKTRGAFLGIMLLIALSLIALSNDLTKIFGA